MANLSTDAFNSGELTPWLNARSVDLDKAKRACSTLENMLVTTYGAVRRRPGTVFLAEAKNADKPCRVWGFNFNSETSYVIEIGENYMRMHEIDDDNLIVNPTAYFETTTTYAQEHIFELNLKQVNDVVWVTHPLYEPSILRRLTTGPSTWDFATADFTQDGAFPPLRDQNVDTTLLMRFTEGGLDPGLKPGNTGFLHSDFDIFDPKHVGAFWAINHTRTATEGQLRWEGLTTSAVGTFSDGIYVDGAWSLTTHGGPANTFTGLLVLQRSFDGGETYEDYRSYYNDAAGNADSRVNYSDAGFESEPVYMRFTLQGEGLPNINNNNSAVLMAESLEVGGIVRITAYGDARDVAVEVVREIFKTTNTDRWAEGAWSDYNGYPGSSTIHELRVLYAGTTRDPAHIWGSATDDFFNFRLGVNDSDSWVYAIGSGEQNEIRSLVSQKDLLILTSGGEWVATGTDGEPITPTNIRIQRHSNFGSEDIQGVVIDNVTVFVQRGGRRVQQYTYNWSEERYNATDLTMLAEHVTKGQVVTFDYQRNRDSIIWIVTGDGMLAGMTYERNEQVYGWHRHETQGAFESCATTYGTGEEDRVWFSVQREDGAGNVYRAIEYFEPESWRILEENDRDKFHHVDCGNIVLAPADGEVSMVGDLQRFEGLTVELWGDGDIMKPQVVEGGQVTLEYPVQRVSVGLPFLSQLQTFPMELGMRDGSSLSRQKFQPRVTMKLRSTLLAEIANTPDYTGQWELIDFRQLGDQGDSLDSGVRLFTGDKEAQCPGGHAREITFTIRSVGPAPFSLLSVNSEIETTKK